GDWNYRPMNLQESTGAAPRDSSLQLLKRIDRHLNAVPDAACDTLRSGPFKLFFRRATPMPFLNYARPLEPFLSFTLEDIQAAYREFQAHGRIPRWEYIEELAPGLTEALVGAGLPEPERRPLMVIRPERFVPGEAPGILIRQITSADDLVRLRRTMMRALRMEHTRV